MRWLLAAMVLVASGVLASATAAGQPIGKSVSWQRYDVDVALQADGSLVVTETQTIDFTGTFHQATRTIALDRTTGISDVSVAELTGGSQTLSYRPGQDQADTFSTTTSSSSQDINWWFPETTNGTRTFVLHYVAHGAARLYDDGDQIDWDVISTDRPGAIAGGTITLHLPAAADPAQIKSAWYETAQGRLPQEASPATIVDERTLRFDVTNLPSGSGAEVRAQVPHGLLTAATTPPWQAAADRADWLQQTVKPVGSFLVLLLALAIVGGGGTAVVLLWYTRGREPAVGPLPGQVEEPPSDLPAPLAGVLVDGRADIQDAVAILVDLAHRGVLSLKEEPGPRGSDVRVGLHGPTEDPSLRPFERVLLVALFGQGVSEGEILLSSARIRFASAVPILEERLYEAVVEARLFVSNPQTTRRQYLRLGLITAGLGLLTAIIMSNSIGWLVGFAWLPGGALLLVGLAVAWLAGRLAPRTAQGALEAARWRAFRQYLLQAPPSGLHSALLPYAVAFGIDRRFLQRLESSGAPAPVGYVPTGPGPIIFWPGGMYGGYGGGGGGHQDGGWSVPQPVGGGASTASGPQGWSDALADLLNAASGALASGGGSGPWSGGGWGGGGGGGGGSEVFN